MKMKKIPHKKILILILIIIILIPFCLYQNKHLVLTTYTYESEKLGEDLDGYRIVPISDLYNTALGKKNKKIPIIQNVELGGILGARVILLCDRLRYRTVFVFALQLIPDTYIRLSAFLSSAAYCKAAYKSLSTYFLSMVLSGFST